MSSPEKDNELRAVAGCEEDRMGCNSASPSLRSDFCNQICRIFDESDDREKTDGQPCSSSSFLPSNQQNSTDEAIKSSFLNSIVNDLLGQRPSQFDVLVSGKRNENSNEVGLANPTRSNSESVRKSASATTRNQNDSFLTDQNSLRPQSEPPIYQLMEGISSCAQTSSISSAFQNSPLVSTENCCEDEIIDVSSGENSNGQLDNLADNCNSRNCQHSHQKEGGNAERCAFDPVTKRRFYEPHKRSGCDGIYCLSQITQIGERICNVENKLARLAELFIQLTDAENNETCQMPQQKPQKVGTSRPPSRYLLAQRSVPQFRTQSAVNNKRLPIVSRNLFLPNPHNNTCFSSICLPKEPDHRVPPNTLSVPSKVLECGLRIYFPENGPIKNAVANAIVCPVCFAKFEPFPNLHAHVLRHLDKKCMAEFFSCKLCKDSNCVLFLSVTAIREHIRTAHGVATDSYLLTNIYPGNNTHKGTTRIMVQEVLKRFARFRFEQWRNVRQIKTNLGSLKRNCSFPPVDDHSWKRKKGGNEGGKGAEEDVIDRILFFPSQIPQNLSERFHRLKKMDRISRHQMIVPICGMSSFVGLSNVRIAKLAKSCSTHK
ncbi:hypothetical protein niasHS_006815 [Heterodera schachtii]|uniref:C2H2-type domain-containing protein n=1 Tax=Heterodera schachtii TaxID=97005 RepID=A0ABD2JIB7_HETSC